ncbi:hypothetical protein SAMN05444411_1031 [Lutibacter oricola]|uniref:DUF1684 domain-containing protein n=1 Tax=Lutibacter oricola TaxID=762486 RepID=A0A1H2YMI4_9FLAO|nr:DUF1684 domain-containing protein [Lutibacter oricola]SDX06290.1 hypothetical protein SAMN05444411_1031 [Lutibacter oricola]
MKKIITIFTLLLLITSCTNSQKNYSEEIKLHQYELNTFYANEEESPLTKEDLKEFKTLDFFEINETYKIEANFELTPNEPVFEMKTSTERLPLYKKYGVATFNLNGKEFELSIYQNQSLLTSVEYKDHLFLPFNDLTNSKTSYGGGRYIDLEIPPTNSKTITIDFNKAYNPYCAYNHKYSCPIPPSENNLDIEIKAGVKKFKKH